MTTSCPPPTPLDLRQFLVEQALRRPALIWSPFDGHETRGYPPIPVPGDPERPFGIVRRIKEYSWTELTGHEDILTHRTYFTDCLAGINRDWRISHWWHDDPEATSCQFCGEINANHPDYRYAQDTIQCQIIRNHTLDYHLARPPSPDLRDLMDQLVHQDVQEMLKRTPGIDR